MLYLVIPISFALEALCRSWLVITSYYKNKFNTSNIIVRVIPVVVKILYYINTCSGYLHVPKCKYLNVTLALVQSIFPSTFPNTGNLDLGPRGFKYILLSRDLLKYRKSSLGARGLQRIERQIERGERRLIEKDKKQTENLRWFSLQSK